MIKEYKLIGDSGIMPATTVIKPGETVKLDDGDPRVAIWLEDSVIAESETVEKAELERLQAELDNANAATEKAEEKVAERKKPGPKPKAKEGE